MSNEETDTTHRTSGCPVCGSNDMHALHGELRQCINCGSTADSSGAVVTEGAVDSVERSLGTTPAQPLPEEALIEQAGAPDLDRVRGTTPPQPLPVDAWNDPRVLGTTPPQPVPDPLATPAPVYADSTGATSDTPPPKLGDPVVPVEEPPAPELVNADAAEAVADPAQSTEEAVESMPPRPPSEGNQPLGDDSYKVTSGFPTGEEKIVTPDAAPVEPAVVQPETPAP